MLQCPCDCIGALPHQARWQGLQTVVMVISERRLWNKTTREVRFYISLPSMAQVLAAAIRTHWGIENTVHWTLDVTFNEDASRTRPRRREFCLSDA